MIGIGLFLQRCEVEAPARAPAHASCSSWRAARSHKIQDSRYGGKFGGLARDINAAIERFTHAPTQRSDMAGKDLNAILGHRRAAARSTCRPRTRRSAAATPPPAFAPPPAAVVLAARRRRRRFSAPPLAQLLAAARRPASRRRSRSAPRRCGFGRRRRQSMPASAGSDVLPAAGRDPPPPWAVAARPPRCDDDDAPGRSPTATATRVVPYDPDEEEEAHFRHIFDDFIAKKRECGESTAA